MLENQKKINPPPLFFVIQKFLQCDQLWIRKLLPLIWNLAFQFKVGSIVTGYVGRHRASTTTNTFSKCKYFPGKATESLSWRAMGVESEKLASRAVDISVMGKKLPCSQCTSGLCNCSQSTPSLALWEPVRKRSHRTAQSPSLFWILPSFPKPNKCFSPLCLHNNSCLFPSKSPPQFST